MHLPTFGSGSLVPNGCAQDALQFKLLEIYDDLRKRHERIKIVLEAKDLDDDLLRGAKEAVHLQFKGVDWNFFTGEEEKKQLEAIAINHSITTISLSLK